MILSIPRQIARTAALASVAACVSATLAGCGQANGGTSTRTALFRIVDASPDAGVLDISLNSTAAAYNLGFGSVSSYFPVTPGTYTISADIAGTHTVLTTLRAPLNANTQYTFLVGNVAAGLQSALLTDQGISAPGGQVAVRFLEQIARTGPVDVYLVPAGATLTASAPVVQNLGFGQVRPYQNITAGSYSVVVLPATTVPTSSTVPLYSGNQINLPGSSARTVLLLDGQPTSASTVQAVTLSDYDSPNSSY